MNWLKWLHPGMGVKRWLLMLMLGITMVSLGIAYVLVSIYREQPFPEWVGIVTLQFLDRIIRAAIFVALGAFLVIYPLRRLSQSLVSPFLDADDNLVDKVFEKRILRKGPKVVAIGGGTGLSTLLRGLKLQTSNLTAIVTVADDGGSTGMLRRDLAILPPGDFRQCIVALAEAEPLMTELFQYRFSEGDGLKGHSFGNLFIAAMLGINGNNFERAISETSRVLAVRGRILPSTLTDIRLHARFGDGSVLVGESKIGHAGKEIERLSLEPEHVPAYTEAVRAIWEADLIVVGPGSLYTSVLPNLLVEDIARAVRTSSALKVYVCNVATEHGETDNFKVIDHVHTISRHVGGNLFDCVLANNNFTAAGAKPSVQPVPVNGERTVPYEFAVIEADVVDESNALRHDPRKLAEALMMLYAERGGNRNGNGNGAGNGSKSAAETDTAVTAAD